MSLHLFTTTDEGTLRSAPFFHQARPGTGTGSGRQFQGLKLRRAQFVKVGRLHIKNLKIVLHGTGDL